MITVIEALEAARHHMTTMQGLSVQDGVGPVWTVNSEGLLVALDHAIVRATVVQRVMGRMGKELGLAGLPDGEVE